MNMSSLIKVFYLIVFCVTTSNSQSKFCNQTQIINELKNCTVNELQWHLSDKINNNNIIINNTIVDLIRLIQTLNNHVSLKNCFKSACNSLFNNCEFEIDINNNNNGNSLNVDSLAAARLANLLTGFTYNEASDTNSNLNLNYLNSLLQFSLLDNDNIYDVKLIFKEQKNFNLRAFKSNKTIQILNYNVDETTSSEDWFRKWLSEEKSIASESTYQLKLENSLIKNLQPTVNDLNRIKFVSGVSYDCENYLWRRINSVPFLYPSGEIRGIVVMSISLEKYDIKQCGSLTTDIKNRNKQDIFTNTDKCDRQTTECINVENKGFVLDSYTCKCKPGYYRNPSLTNVTNFYACLKCAEGCKTCIDDQPCITDVPLHYKQIALIVNLICILICIILIFLTWYNMSMNMLKTSSVKMLFIVLIGSIVSYSEIIPMYFAPSYWTCTAAQILQLEGFLLTYGALVLKTWRECKLFYVRSIRTIKITEKTLMERLGFILIGGTVYLIVWCVRKVDSPKEIEVFDTNNVTYKMCSITEWNFISMALQSCILLWGVILSIQVGRASIAFKETKLISWSIFNECVVTCFVITISVLIKNTRVSCYVPFFLNVTRIHLQITVMLLLLFTYKIYTVIISRKKPFQSNQSNLLNFSGSVRDGDQKNSSVNEETEKERELKIEIQRLYRQIEEMRSLSMRIANLHLLTKKSKFIAYPTKKLKSSKQKNFLMTENETSKQFDAVNVVNNTPDVHITTDKSYGKLKTIEEETEKLNSIQLNRTKSKNK